MRMNTLYYGDVLSLALIVLVSGLLITIAIYLLIHLRPLSSSEVHAVAVDRRKRAIQAHFRYTKSAVRMDTAFKRSMNPKGQVYSVAHTFHEFPMIAASHLKWKKHEWIIVAFEQNLKIERIWLNKGDRGSVGPLIPFDCLLDQAHRSGVTSILIFHNHPNNLPHRFKLYNIMPSGADREASQDWSHQAMEFGISVIHFICDRGNAYPYKISCPDCFLPLSAHMEQVEAENGQCKLRNLKLHNERIFRKSKEKYALLGEF